jgi:hypothetical protein
MTKPGLGVGDNGGRCESCDDPETAGKPQTGHPVLLGGGLGWGKMWLCPKCLTEHQERDRKKDEQMERARAWARSAMRPATLAAEFGVDKETVVEAIAKALLPFIQKLSTVPEAQARQVEKLANDFRVNCAPFSTLLNDHGKPYWQEYRDDLMRKLEVDPHMRLPHDCVPDARWAVEKP